MSLKRIVAWLILLLLAAALLAVRRIALPGAIAQITMTPRPVVYSCLALTIAFVCWLLIWR
jgi:hypothetical protein